MSAKLYQLAHATNHITASVLNGLWEGAAMALIAWLILKVCKHLNAATRYVIWCAVFIAVGALTFMAVVNGFQNRRVAESTQTTNELAKSDLSVVPLIEVGGVKPSEPRSAMKRPPQLGDTVQTQPVLHAVQMPSGPRLLAIDGAWTIFFIAVWALVTPFLLGRLALSYVHLKKLKRAAVPFDDACQNRFRLLLRNAGISRSIRFRHSNSVSVPVALGLSNPVVLIPRELLNQLEESELEQIVLHEAAHLARRDDWSNLVQRVLVALLFFHPAVHWISRRLILERELACDDRVTSATGRIKPYALCLTKLAELNLSGSTQVLASGAWISKTQLTRRIIMLLNDKLNRTTRVSTAGSATAAIGLCGLLFLFAQLGQLVAADNPKANAGNAQTDATTPTSDAASLKPPHSGSAPLTEEDRRKAAELHKKVFASLMETLKNETNSELRNIAMNALARMDHAKIVEPLVEIVVKDADHQLRIDALSVLAGQPSTDGIRRMPILRDPGIRIGLLPILRDSKSTEALLKLYDELKESKLRIAILEMLGDRHRINRTGDDLASTDQWISKLQQIARESTVLEIKAEAIRQLGLVAYNGSL